MFIDFKLEGQWFLPGTPDIRLGGTLTYEVGGRIELVILGKFSDDFDDQDIILGMSTTGHLFTLLECLNIGGKDSSRGISSRRYSVHMMVKNRHCNFLDELKFDRVFCRYNLFEEWIGKSGFELDEVFSSSSLKVSYKEPSPIKFRIDEFVVGEINFSRSGLSMQRVQKKIEVEQQAIFEMKFYALVSLETILRYQFKFQNFLTLATAEAVFPKEIIIHSSTDNDGSIETELFFRPSSINKKIVEEKIDTFMLFNFKVIEKSFDLILKNWFEKCDKLSPIIVLLFNNLYRKSDFTTFTFLGIVQGLETFHRYTNLIADDEKIAFYERLEGIVKVLNVDDAEMIKSKMRYAYEPSLRNRLRDLIDMYATESILPAIGKKSDFISKVVNNRNYYTHYDKSLESSVMDTPKLIRVTSILQYLLISGILIEIGFERSVVSEIYSKNRQIKFLIDRS